MNLLISLCTKFDMYKQELNTVQEANSWKNTHNNNLQINKGTYGTIRKIALEIEK